MSYAQIVFSKQQQSAVIGHALSNPRHLQTMIHMGITPLFFTEHVNGARLWKVMLEFTARNRRAPTVEELRSTSLFTKEDPRIVTAANKAVDEALEDQKSMGTDALMPMMVEWVTAWKMREGIEELMAKWNRGDIGEAKDLLLTTAETVRRCSIDAISKDSAEWYDTSIERQASMPSRLLYTGVRFLDEPMSGLRPDDLVVISTYTGFGKTQLMTLIAYNMAEAGKSVKLFALEAGDAEIELRIRFGKMLENYYSGGGKAHVDYVPWSRGLHPELRKFEADPAGIKAVLKNISITYKKTSRYGIEQLERDIVQVADTVDIILVDHLHYIDKGSKKNETEALSDIVRRIRDVNLNIDKTIVLAAHVKKNQEARRFQTMLPSTDDIYGSGDVSKTATWIWTLGQPTGIDPDKFPADEMLKLNYGFPTLARCLKSRDGGGSRTAYTLVPFYKHGGYNKPDDKICYTIGRTQKADTLWVPTTQEGIPSWAKSAFAFETRGMRDLKQNTPTIKKAA